MSNNRRLLNRDFLLLWQGQTVSLVGTQISMIAMLFWLKHTTESPALMGALQTISGLVSVLVGPIGGAFADRYPRRKIIIFSDLINGGAMLLLGLFLWFGPPPGTRSLVVVFAVSIVSAVVGSFFGPAISAALPDLAPPNRVASANSLIQSTMQLAGLGGQAIGGLLFRMLGAPIVFLIDGSTYLFSAFSECFIRLPQNLPPNNGGWRLQLGRFRDEIVEGLVYIRRNEGLFQLVILSSLVSFFIAPIVGLLTFYVEDHLRLSPDWFGYLLTIHGAGTLAGLGFAGTFRFSPRLRGGMILGCFLAESLVYGLLGFTNKTLTVGILAFIAGMTTGFVGIHLMTLLQLTTPTGIRGRVFGMLATLSACITPLGMGLGGVAASLSGRNIPLIYATCGICILILVTVATTRRKLRAFLATPEMPPEPYTLQPSPAAILTVAGEQSPLK